MQLQSEALRSQTARVKSLTGKVKAGNKEAIEGVVGDAFCLADGPKPQAGKLALEFDTPSFPRPTPCGLSSAGALRL